MTDGLQGPEHSDSFPPESSLSRASEGHTRPNTASVSRAESSGGVEGPDLSMHSREPINVSFQDEQEERDLEGGPRKRKSLLGKWRNHGEGNGDETASASTADGDPEDKEEDKQKFTLVGQLKATVFNSWMNIFILAAPVGSEFARLSNMGEVLTVVVALSQVKGIDPVVVFVVNFIAIMYDPVIYERRSQLTVQSSCGYAGLCHGRSCHAHRRDYRWSFECDIRVSLTNIPTLDNC